MPNQTSRTINNHPKDIVLVGGGHAHVAVIRNFGMQPWHNVRLTVVSKDVLTPYSGMLPGWIAGHYAFDDCHIDLRKLCQWAGVRLFHDEVCALELDKQQVHCKQRPWFNYDYLSLDTGSQSGISMVSGATDTGAAVKPIDSFMTHWLAICAALEETQANNDNNADFTIAVVGGGAAGVEVCLAMQHRLSVSNSAASVKFHLVSSDKALLGSHNVKVQHFFKTRCVENGVTLHTGKACTQAQDKILTLSDGSTIEADFIVWALPAQALDWLKASGLDCDQNGFVQVNRFLQSTSHPNIFAAGDNASLNPSVAKSGVYAVRQGPVLTENLRRTSAAQQLQAYKPQKHFLSLVSTGDQHAIGSRGDFAIAGDWVWQLKNLIDKRFMQRYQELPTQPAMRNNMADASNNANPEAAEQMRCGGCAAKVSSRVLERVLNELNVSECPDALHLPRAANGNRAEDAALLKMPPGKTLVQTIDYFRQFIDDPYLLGKIGSNHCLGDIYAMGATPHSALAICTLPHGKDAAIENDLRAILAGAVESLSAAGAALIGGHSNEGAELAFGLSINGLIEPHQLLSKSGLKPKQQLILTKPLGSGVLLAANMQNKARADWIDAAFAQMEHSAADAAAIFIKNGATACTDITGFGLVGHLAEMLEQANVGAEINLSALPLLAGAEQCLAMGVRSTLHPSNASRQANIENFADMASNPIVDILFDPQTAGGLLAGVPNDNADQAIRELKNAGYQAVIIGSIKEGTPGGSVLLAP